MAQIANAVRRMTSSAISGQVLDLHKSGLSRVVPRKVGIWPFQSTVMVVQVEYYVKAESIVTFWLDATEKDMATELDTVVGTSLQKVLTQKALHVDSVRKNSTGLDLIQYLEGLKTACWAAYNSLPRNERYVERAKAYYQTAGIALALAEQMEANIAKDTADGL